jgi:hypothetical protein
LLKLSGENIADGHHRQIDPRFKVLDELIGTDKICPLQRVLSRFTRCEGWRAQTKAPKSLLWPTRTAPHASPLEAGSGHGRGQHHPSEPISATVDCRSATLMHYLAGYSTTGPIGSTPA